MASRRLIITAYGRVQGVLFRHSVHAYAKKCNLTGFARNERDGSLVIVAEGEKPPLDEFLAWCRKGPPLARVDEIHTEWQNATGEFRSFEVL